VRAWGHLPLAPGAEARTSGVHPRAALGNSLGDCEEHREAYDAPRAEFEAWRFARRVLEPWTTATREIGSDELTGVMENALGEAEEAVAAAHDRLERAEAVLGAGSRPRTVPDLRAGVPETLLLAAG
jgi:hypothetical protein